MWIDEQSALRQDVAHNILYPTLDAGDTGLRVLTQKKVMRVIFDENKRATGVEYTENTGNPSGASRMVKARKLVVLASGALGTPQVLERSGIGNKALLSKLDIPIVSELPGVGNNYQDHHVIFYPYRSTASADETLDGIFSGRLTFEEALKQKAASPDRHILGWNGLDCIGKLRPSEDEVKGLGEELEQLWVNDYKERETRPLMFLSSVAAFVGNHADIPAGQHFSLGPTTPYPYSRGSIHITDNNVFSVPRFSSGFFEHPADVQKHIWGYKKQREIARRMAHYKGPLEIGHPTFAPDSMASFEAVDEATKKAGYPQPIEYSEQDDKAIETFIRKNVGTAWHSMGTCAMKPRDNDGVVDKYLNVYGVSQLKLIGKCQSVIFYVSDEK